MEAGREAESLVGCDPQAMSAVQFADCAPERVELTERQFDGVSVALCWTRGTDVLVVTVEDAASGDSFELVLGEKERPLDVFYHPFAHARARGIELIGDRRRAAARV
jgi:hypothetical protein